MDKKYDHSIAEQEARALWQQEKVYKAENNPGKSFTIDTPPPTASGNPPYRPCVFLYSNRYYRPL